MHKRLAEVLVGYSTEVRQGDTVRIESYDTSALPVMRETFGAALRAGGHPVANLVLEETEGILYNEGRDHQLDWISPDQQWNIEHGDVWIIFDAVTNTKRLSNVDPERISRRLTARRPLQTLYLERSERGEFRWLICGSACEAVGAGRRHVAAAVRAGAVSRRLPRPGRSGRRLEAVRRSPRARRRLPGRRAGAAHRRRGHGPQARRRGANLDPLERPPELPGRRGVHGPARDERGGDDQVLVPGDDARAPGRRRPPPVRGRRGRRGDRETGPGLPARDGRHGRRSAARR